MSTPCGLKIYYKAFSCNDTFRVLLSVGVVK